MNLNVCVFGTLREILLSRITVKYKLPNFDETLSTFQAVQAFWDYSPIGTCNRLGNTGDPPQRYQNPLSPFPPGVSDVRLDICNTYHNSLPLGKTISPPVGIIEGFDMGSMSPQT